MKFFAIVCLLLVSCFTISLKSIAQSSLLNKQHFLKPPGAVKIHAWWHWVDNAITKEGITRDLESMKQQGVVQATILNVSLFKQKDFGVKQVRFNSPEWYDMFEWALKEANRLGMFIGAHNCDGWSSSGGPWITPEKSMKQYTWTKTLLKGGGKKTVTLSVPHAQHNFYRDVAVVAYKSSEQQNSFQAAKPTLRFNDTAHVNFLYDGSPVSAVSMKRGDAVLISFPKEFSADKIVIHPRRQFMWSAMSSFKSKFQLLSSADGKSFKKVQDIELTGLNRSMATAIPATKSKLFKLVLNDISNLDPWIDYMVAEVELLKGDERPSYAPAISHHLEKTVSVKSGNRDAFDLIASGKQNNLIADENAVIDISGMMDKNGTLNWHAPAGNWNIIRFGYTTTGAINAPATEEGTGLECDKMDSDALDLHFNSFSKKLIEQAGNYAGNTFKFLLVDSWECGYQNWTDLMPKRFKELRGYDLTSWIPVLCGETIANSEQSDAFLYDFRKTIAELIEHNYYERFRELCHKNKVEFHSEVIYGDANYPPLDVLKSNSYIDLPMYEFWAGPNQQSLLNYRPSARAEANFPVYSSVLYNKPVIAAEAYTGYAHYSESPWDLKSFGDRAFSSGINQMILHSYVHQPFEKKPGLTLGGFAAHFNRHTPWWQYSSSWMDYQSRIQYVLQQGEMSADVLYYLGDQLPQFIENQAVNSLPPGYRVNACNYDVLKNKATVKGGEIRIGNNQSYKILVLQEDGAMELETLQRIGAMIDSGALVFGAKPSRMLSLHGVKNSSGEFQQLADKIWGTAKDKNENIYGKGKVVWGRSLSQVLIEMKLTPAFSTGLPDTLNLMYLHKKLGEQDVFFVANQQDRALTREFVFRTRGKVPEIWDPMNGVFLKPMLYKNDKGQIRIPLTLKNREALMFIFSGNSEEEHFEQLIAGGQTIFPSKQMFDTSVTLPGIRFANNRYSVVASNNTGYTLFTNTGKKVLSRRTTATAFNVNEINGTISFHADYSSNLPTVNITSLKPLNEFEDPSIKYFSGVAEYKVSFKSPVKINSSDSVFLCLGDIEAAAELWLNGQLLGTVWSPTQTFDVSRLLKPTNQLQVKVATTYRNRILGDLRESGEFKNGWSSVDVKDNLSQEKILKPSGWMGPLQLMIIKQQ
ncbi:MAG TPA: glycosyl hydrolase [Chitinophagaceae bacterium]|nr:glycosyl hydrolase [Chitinophagaceae bacterium]